MSYKRHEENKSKSRQERSSIQQAHYQCHRPTPWIQESVSMHKSPTPVRHSRMNQARSEKEEKERQERQRPVEPLWLLSFITFIPAVGPSSLSLASGGPHPLHPLLLKPVVRGSIPLPLSNNNLIAVYNSIYIPRKLCWFSTMVSKFQFLWENKVLNQI